MPRRHTRFVLALVLLIAALLTPLREASGGRARALPRPVPIPSGSAAGAALALSRTLDPAPVAAGRAPAAAWNGLGARLAPAREAGRAQAVADYGNLPLAFELNAGQTDPSVSYLARGAGYVAFLTPSSLTLALSPPASTAALTATVPFTPAAPPTRTVVRLQLEGAGAQLPPEAQDPLPGVVNYLTGGNASAWHTNIPTYGQVTYPQVYPGVDLVYHGQAHQVAFDFTVHPGAQAGSIRMRLAGAERTTQDAQGNLVLQTGSGTLTVRVPSAYQQVAGRRRAVGSHYQLLGTDEIGLTLDTYDATQPVTIDPVLVYSGYLGGSLQDTAAGIAVDGGGNAYVTGYTNSTNFPTTTGASQSTLTGSFDAFVSKLNAAGSALVYSTYLGGSTTGTLTSSTTAGYGIAVDSGGNAYVTGETNATNFPTTTGALQRTYTGDPYDAFVSKLNAAGSALAYSTYLGGASQDIAYGIAVDGSGAAYVAGSTSSTNFPTTSGALQRTFGGGPYDAFVSKLNAAGSALAYSTYLGGSGNEVGNAIAVDSTGAAYVAGNAYGANFPTTSGALQTAFGGGASDAVVSKLNSAGSALIYSTYLGGSAADEGLGIAVDGTGAAYVAGYTKSINFPTVGAFQPTLNGPYNAFVSKLNAAGSALAYSTYLGGSGGDNAMAIAVDGAGQATVVGGTGSTDFPTVAAPQAAYGGGPANAFVSRLNPTGSALAYSTYLGGSGNGGTFLDPGDYATGVAVDSAGTTYVTGATDSTNFPTVNARQPSYGGGYEDAFVAKLSAPGCTGGTAPASSGTVPWHPHYATRVTARMGLSVDLADGHADLAAADTQVVGRGPDLAVRHTWDSSLALGCAASSSGLGWQSGLTRKMSGAPGSTVTYTDAGGARWVFPYTGGAYQVPAGLPWSLTATSSAYTLTNILTGEALGFDNQGRFVSDTDAYGNSNTLAQGGTGAPTRETNSGGRALAMTYANGLLNDIQSPLYQGGGPAQQGSQHVAYGYDGQELTGIAWGAQTSDQQAASFAYNASSLLVSVTTPMTISGTLAVTRTWKLAYDASNRLVGVTSPISGTVGQPGYTPAYTTQIQYSAGQTAVTEGYGSANPIVHTYTLDGSGRASAIADGLSHTRHYTYDADNDVLTGQDGNGNTTTNHYQYIGPNNAYGQVTEVDHPQIRPLYPTNAPVAPTTHYVYDPTSHDLTERYDNYGAVSYYTYNGQHDIVGTAALTGTTTLGGATAFHWRGQLRGYDPYGEPTSAIDGRGVSVPDTSSTNTAPGVTANGSAASYTHSSTYTSYGDKTSASTPPITTTRGGTTSTGPAITQYTYDGDGNQITMQSANNYNAADPTANATTYGYDHLGRQNSVKQPSLTVVGLSQGALPTGRPLTTIKFDGDGNAAMKVTSSGADIYYSYDPLDRLVSTQQPLSLRTDPDPRAVAQTALTISAYTATNLASSKDPQGHISTYTYDAANRLTSAVNAAGHQVSYGYDSANNQTSTVIGNSASPTSTIAIGYDALNEPISRTTSGPNLSAPLTTTYSYDLHSNLVRTQAPNNDTSFAAYDLADRLVGQELDPGAPNTPTGAHVESFAYDAAGNRVGSVDFRGGTTAMAVDGDNRQTSQTDSYTGVPTISSAAGFDPDGNRVGQTQTVGGQTHSFATTLNPADWPSSATNDGLTTNANGTGAGDVLAQTIQNGAGNIAYNIDQTGQQNEIGVTSMGSTTPLTTTLAFNNNEQMTALALPNGVEQDAGYNGANRLSQVTAQNTANHALLNNLYQYGFDARGLINTITTTVQGSAGTQTLTHDAAGRLTTVVGGASPGSWAYDGLGNLTSATVGGVTKTYTYAAGNPEEVASTSISGQPATVYGYDGNGNATSITNTGTLARQLAYDAQSRLVQITLGSPITSTIALTYNAFGQRASYTVTPAGAGQPSLAESFKYQSDHPSQVAYTGTSVTTPYTDTYVYTQDGVPLELLRQQQGAGTATPYWYVIDGQGNVVALTDQNGNVVDSYQYDQWGRPISVSETVPQQLRYGGTWYDNETQWYWLGVRAYDPALERFLQPDPSEQEGLFSYIYAGDNPSDLGDPSGLRATPSRSRAIPNPPQSGMLETAGPNDAFENNVQFPSPQLTIETSSGGAKVVSAVVGILGPLAPSGCAGLANVCAASSRSDRTDTSAYHPNGYGDWPITSEAVRLK